MIRSIKVQFDLFVEFQIIEVNLKWYASGLNVYMVDAQEPLVTLFGYRVKSSWATNITTTSDNGRYIMCVLDR